MALLFSARRGGAFPIGVFCALAFWLAGCGEKAAPSFERPPAPVESAAAVARDVPTYLDAVGKFVAREVVTIAPQVSGRIVGIHFTDGGDVAAGQALFTIDPRPFEAQLNSARANLAQAQAELELARSQFARVENVADPRAVSRQDFDTRKSAVAVAQAQVSQQQAAVDNARLNLAYTKINAPIDGRAGQRLIDLGNVVNANTSALLVIQRMDPIYADFTVAEQDLSAVQKNLARGGLTVEVRLPDDLGEPRAGKLTFLDNAVQEGTGTVKLRATIANRDRHFWPGRFANVRLILGIRRDSILVPAEAPQVSAKGSFVYVVKDGASAELRPVKVGQRQGELVAIEEGLKGGEQVVVKGQLGVTPGGKVRIVQPAKNNQPTPTSGGENKS